MSPESRAGEVATCLSGGGVVLLPTDTVYGLAVSPLHNASVDRLYAIKGRPTGVKLPVMVASEAMLSRLGAEINESARRLLRSALVPGALTLALGLDARCAPSWLAGRDEVAVRIPDDALLLAVLNLTGPLLVTSANAHGAPTSETMSEALAQLNDSPDLAIDGGVRPAVPSTLVNCRYDPPIVEREGIVSAQQIWEQLGCSTTN
jgi:L-threonylcarbamoyladenylate synthase